MEREFYQRMRAGMYQELADVVPMSYTAQEVLDRIDTLTEAQSGALDDQRNVYIENITSGLDDPGHLDTKIGGSTASYRENRAQQGKSVLEAGVKSLKMAIVDRLTGSTDRGWRVVAGSDVTGDNRRQAGKSSEEHLRAFSEDPEVWDKLIGKMEKIRGAVRASGLGLVATSVFSVRGTKEGERVVDAKLIDFAHVIDAKRPFVGKVSPELQSDYQRNFIEGMDSLIKESRTIRTEKQESRDQRMRQAAASLRPGGTPALPASAAPAHHPPAASAASPANTMGGGRGR